VFQSRESSKGEEGNTLKLRIQLNAHKTLDSGGDGGLFDKKRSNAV